MKPIYLLLCLLIIPALACSTAGFAEGLVPSGGVLYQDYFANTNSGWDGYSGPAGSAAYINDAYHIVLKQPNVNLWTHPGKIFSDVREEVSVMPVSGPQANRMGLICRLKDEKNFYFFVISADGYYGIGKSKDGTVILLNGNLMEKNVDILTGTQENRLRADCIGKQLSLYVNNTKVASVQDGDFASGDVGILAGSFEKTGVDVYFDNFIVYKP